MNDSPAARRRILWVVIAITVAWGAYISVGGVLHGYDEGTRTVTYSVNPLRGLIMAGFVVGFVGIWVAALLFRQWRRGDMLSDDPRTPISRSGADSGANSGANSGADSGADSGGQTAESKRAAGSPADVAEPSVPSKPTSETG